MGLSAVARGNGILPSRSPRVPYDAPSPGILSGGSYGTADDQTASKWSESLGVSRSRIRLRDASDRLRIGARHAQDARFPERSRRRRTPQMMFSSSSGAVVSQGRDATPAPGRRR
jgi:hypothetical protein